ncbi:acetyltransferase [Halomonas sp. PAMB 3232]|uniref:acetyltransferase n=1 Tax=Halomonas sp. PAMB 3232 TaxID=3075221 RepID=UPI002899A2A9|nr:acetyltransferase [Halomonas sp. PAMB 3232]WNL38084.1 acetyltransferase [Halomonas sp. PAMB 3232]
MLTPVIQREPTGCGIASAATILGLTYADMKARANAMGIYAEDESLWSSTDYVRRLLAHKQVATSPKELPFTGWQALPDLALIAIKPHQRDGKHFWHWAVFQREKGKSVVLDSASYLPANVRTDFDAMHPAWFIAVTPSARADFEITTSTQSDYPALIALWEASVRATHDFLAEEDLLMLKPLIFEQFFDVLELRIAKGHGDEVLGFSGVADGKLEMLFIAPQARGQGIGKTLVDQALNQGVSNVDVNEQNTQALGFYQRLGFEVKSRSPVDGLGKPYPLLHMAFVGRTR